LRGALLLVALTAGCVDWDGLGRLYRDGGVDFATTLPDLASSPTDFGVGPGGDLGCPFPTVPCGGACVDTSNDPSHCGLCQRACVVGASCVNGSCQSPTYLHHDGFGDTWTDAVPTGTYDLTQATTACQTYLANHGVAGDRCSPSSCTMATTQLVALFDGNNLAVYLWFFLSDGVAKPGEVDSSSCDAATSSWD
jgi:hypothetical protein